MLFVACFGSCSPTSPFSSKRISSDPPFPEMRGSSRPILHVEARLCTIFFVPFCPHTKPSAHNAGSRKFFLNTTGSPSSQLTTVVGLAFRQGVHKNRRHIFRNLEPLLCFAAICSFLALGTFRRLLSMDSPIPTSLSHLFRQHVELDRPNVPPHSCQSAVIFLVVSARSRTRRRLTARRNNILAGTDLHRWLLDHTSHC